MASSPAPWILTRTRVPAGVSPALTDLEELSRSLRNLPYPDGYPLVVKLVTQAVLIGHDGSPGSSGSRRKGWAFTVCGTNECLALASVCS